MAWWRVFECAYVRAGGQIFTEKKRGKETQTLASGPAPPVSYPLPARTQALIKCFFFLDGDHIFIEEVVHFTLIYIALSRRAATALFAISVQPGSFQMQQGIIELFPNSCAQTRWAAGRMKENGKRKYLRRHFGTFLYHSYPQPDITTPALHGRGKVPERVREGCSRVTVFFFVNMKNLIALKL